MTSIHGAGGRIGGLEDLCRLVGLRLDVITYNSSAVLQNAG